MKRLTESQLKYFEKTGRWLRKHNGHKILQIEVDGGVVLVCGDCDKATVRKESNGEDNTV